MLATFDCDFRKNNMEIIVILDIKYKLYTVLHVELTCQTPNTRLENGLKNILFTN